MGTRPTLAYIVCEEIFYRNLESRKKEDFPDYVLERLSEECNGGPFDGMNALQFASVCRDQLAIQYLLERGFDPNLDRRHYDPPIFLLFFEWRHGDGDAKACANLLREHGADLNVKSDHDYTLAHIAVENTNYEAVKWLIEHDAFSTEKNFNNLTPKELAVQKGDARMVELISDANVHD